ncbi:hypothetical protein DFH29DRAFT_1001385 [Suillus ampliporus]|nr:hypothetical protein DFH29DRAFT_1001385 [Suillus ampliporus]
MSEHPGTSSIAVCKNDRSAPLGPANATFGPHLHIIYAVSPPSGFPTISVSSQSPLIMSSVTQIMYFKTSQAYLQNPSQFISDLANKDPNKIDGLSKAYLGFETEDPSNAFWVFEWTSKSAHVTYHQSDVFKATKTASRQVFASKPTHTFVGFPSTTGIFSAPVTEFVTFTLKKGVTMDKLQPLVKKLQSKLPGTPKFYGSSWAPVVDKANVVYGVLGWESVKAHWDAVGSGPLKEIIDEVKVVADIWLVHAILAKYNL